MSQPCSHIREAAGPARGLLHRSVPGGTTEHLRLLPRPELAPYVAHFWWVRWELTQPFIAETLPHPCIHMVFETTGRAEVVGVVDHRFTRKLEGDGRVLGVKFRPGAFWPFVGGSVSRWTNTTVPVEQLKFMGPQVAEQVAVLISSVEVTTAVAAAEALLLLSLPCAPLCAEVLQIRDLVEQMETDRSCLRVEDAARRVGVSVRTLERR
ncbi:MAG: DUF6597 domain-containing transcriptional factor, partial [Myxococcota bacterium]